MNAQSKAGSLPPFLSVLSNKNEGQTFNERVKFPKSADKQTEKHKELDKHADTHPCTNTLPYTHQHKHTHMQTQTLRPFSCNYNFPW